MGSRRAKLSREAMRSLIPRVDRLSNLPDSLLLIILSLLPFDSAVRTTVLSKRWRHLCMSLSNARFDDRYGLFSGVHFNTSVERFLMNRPFDLNIDSFELECGGDADFNYVDQWIFKLLEHQVKDLTLGFSFHGGLYRLPEDMYAYGDFEALRVKRGILVDISDGLRFSMLKVLEFRKVTFSAYESVKEILPNCPVLEDLVINKCRWLGGSHLYVCGSVLKNLVLKCNEYFEVENQHQISIDTPALETLRFGDSTWANLSMEDSLLSLGTARISVESGASVFKLLDKFCNVKFLTLTDHKKLKVLNHISDLGVPILPSLIQLELRVNCWTCWTVLPKILASSPNLQSLLLTYGGELEHDLQDYYNELWSSPRLVPKCLSSSLKTIQIGIFDGTKEEFSLVQYLLLHGRALRKLTIYCSIDSSEWKKFSIRKKIVKFHRGSKTCKINID